MVILFLNTKNKVDVWEAAITMCFVPIMVLLSWAAENGWMDSLFCQTKSNKVKNNMKKFLLLKCEFLDKTGFSDGIWN